MRKDVDKIVDDHIEIILEEIVDIVQNLLALIDGNDFVITPLYVKTDVFQLFSEEILFMVVFATVFIIIDPPLGKSFWYD